MKTKDRDPQSYFAIVDSFLKEAELERGEYSILRNELYRYLTVRFSHGKFVHPIITKFCTDWYREFYRLIGYKDPYKNLKKLSNDAAQRVLPTLNITSLQEAVNISVLGNELDFGAVLVINPDVGKIEEKVQNFKSVEYSVNDTKELQEAIKNSRSILFLTDNAGEIILDIPLLQELRKVIPKHGLYIAAKDSPMLNDVTTAELYELGIDHYGKIVSIGSNGFGLHEEETSIEFKRILKNVDLIIAKGQAYLEFFTEYNFTNVFNITRIKYPVINEALGTLSPHQNVVIHSQRYAHTGKSFQYGTLHPKIIERERIAPLAKRLKEEGKSIVTTNGSFDLVHLGHVRTLEEAKQQGDVLIVGINSDSSVKRYKSIHRPIISEDARGELIASLECVDYVFIFDEINPIAFLEEIKPNVHCNAAEYGENCIEAPTVMKNGGRIHITAPVKGISTTNIIKKINEVAELESERENGRNAAEKEPKTTVRDLILATIKKQNGVIFAEPAIVYRETYTGRDIIAKNSKIAPEYTDERGYVPVEWWIMSNTPAENAIMKPHEGITRLKIGEQSIPLTMVNQHIATELFGEYLCSWPLTKILDIGGEPVKPSFSTEHEVPPIPAHIHPGYIKSGKIIPPGKLEAYFFPPLDTSLQHQKWGRAITRLGLKPETTKEELKKALAEYGISDAMYQLCNTYEIKPYDGWTITPGIVHAPGPWVTFEIQRPQDDFNLLAWQLGKRITPKQCAEHKEKMILKGLTNEDELIKQGIDWNASTDPLFKQRNYRPSRILEQAAWGRRLQIFFDDFYGEAIEVNPLQTFTRTPDVRPIAGIIWSGEGTVNENKVDYHQSERKEFLITPNHQIEIANKSQNEILILYLIFPLKQERHI